MRFIVIGSLVALLCAPACRSKAEASASASSGSAAPEVFRVETVKVSARPFDSTVQTTGSLAPNELVPISAEVSRRLVKVVAREGERVKKGDVLFRLDDADLGATSRELSVRRKLAVDQEARQKKLTSEGLASAADYDKSKSELALIDAQLGTLSVTLAKTTIRAPFDGVLGLRNVSEGAVVSPGAPLISLQDDTTLKVDFSLPERYQAFAARGQKFKLTVEGGAAPVEAEVVAIEPNVDVGSRSLKLRGVIDNAKGLLRAGAFVKIDFPLKSDGGAVFAPTIAVIPSLGGHAVFIAKEGKAARVEVELGFRGEEEVQIVKGLADGDEVIVSNLLRLRPGVPVKATPRPLGAPRQPAPAEPSPTAAPSSSVKAP